MMVCGAAMQPAWPLDAELVYRGRQLGKGDVEWRQVVGARQGVVRKRAAQQLARLPVVNRVFEHRLTDALGYSALNLAPRQHRVDQPTVIIDREVAFERHRSGFRVDLDFRDTEAAQPAALRRGPAPRSKAVGQDPLRHLFEIGAEAAAIDRDPQTRCDTGNG